MPNDAEGNPLLAAGTVAPESINDYEVGMKAQFWDRRATVNLAALRTNIANYQALVTNGQLGVLRGFLANADSARTQGVEADFSLRPNERFNTYLNAAYTDAEYRRFADAPCPPELSGGGSGTLLAAPGVVGNSPANCDISGQRLPGVSEWALSFGANGNVLTTVFGLDGKIYVGVDGSYRSDFSSNPSPSIYTTVAGYALTNIRAGLRGDNRLNIFIWARNIFDVDYFEQLAIPSGNTGLIVGQPGDRATYGLTVKAEF